MSWAQTAEGLEADAFRDMKRGRRRRRRRMMRKRITHVHTFTCIQVVPKRFRGYMKMVLKREDVKT